MFVVHHAHKAIGPAARRRGGLTALALACAGLMAAGCGESAPPDRAAAAAAPTSVGTVRQADCAAWNVGSAAQRRVTVRNLRRFAGGPVIYRTAVRSGRVLEDDRAVRILDRQCAQYFARGFKLYKLYGRAATLVGSRPKPAPDL